MKACLCFPSFFFCLLSLKHVVLAGWWAQCILIVKCNVILLQKPKNEMHTRGTLINMRPETTSRQAFYCKTRCNYLFCFRSQRNAQHPESKKMCAAPDEDRWHRNNALAQPKNTKTCRQCHITERTAPRSIRIDNGDGTDRAEIPGDGFTLRKVPWRCLLYVEPETGLLLKLSYSLQHMRQKEISVCLVQRPLGTLKEANTQSECAYRPGAGCAGLYQDETELFRTYKWLSLINTNWCSPINVRMNVFRQSEWESRWSIEWMHCDSIGTSVTEYEF